MAEKIKEAIKILNQGGIVIYPTDTAFGIGCRMDDEKAVERLFKIRKRPENQATPVLINSIEMAENYLEGIPNEVSNSLILKYWPGALTIILPCIIVKVLKLVRGSGKTLGVRIPDHEIILKLISGIGVPLVGPSANFHGEATPFKYKDINPELVKLVDYVVPGEYLIKQVSTVVDCSIKPWKIIRQGAILINK
jgi:L-threonylcarbamoyladenylate synthase